MAQKVRVAIALVVLTEEPEFWKKEALCEFVGSRVADIQVIETHTFGVPAMGTEDELPQIRFEEEELPKEG